MQGFLYNYDALHTEPVVHYRPLIEQQGEEKRGESDLFTLHACQYVCFVVSALLTASEKVNINKPLKQQWYNYSR